MPFLEAAWLSAAGVALGALAALITSWNAARRRGTADAASIAAQYKGLVDTLTGRIDALESRIEALESEAEERAIVIRRQGDYIATLRTHIVEGKPPPPPPPPDPTETI
jgi:hypothetical protein